jgi:hypothetical protein
MVAFPGEDDPYYPGCHVVHYKKDKVVDVADGKDGSWKVCFGKRPDIELTIYYYKYLDTPPTGEVWTELPITVEGDYTCASALYTGVYMPAGKVIKDSFAYTYIQGLWVEPPPKGSVQPPPYFTEITVSGTKGVGGICSVDALYKVENLMDNIYVEFPIEDNLIVAFPDSTGNLLYFPGCHVMHYEDSLVQKHMGNEKGTWTVCFAAPPEKQITIYYYESMVHIDNHENINPPWVPLPTTIENGLACAPAEYTGVYVPAGK